MEEEERFAPAHISFEGDIASYALKANKILLFPR